MKRVFCIALIAAFLLVLSGCGKPDYVRRAWVCQSPLCGLFAVDEIGKGWDIPQEYAPGTELELGIREGGILTTEDDDTVIQIDVIYSPDTWEYEIDATVSYVNPASRTVEATDADGNVWAFMYYTEGFSVGDPITMIMDNMDTNDNIYDDVVIDVLR